jgi:hypothetical protein
MQRRTQTPSYYSLRLPCEFGTVVFGIGVLDDDYPHVEEVIHEGKRAVVIHVVGVALFVFERHLVHRISFAFADR